MRIDYSTPQRAQALFPVYSNTLFGFRHLVMGCSKHYKLTVAERVKHIALGIFELIPLLGHILACIDRQLHHPSKRVLLLNQMDPYQAGYAHGKQFRSEIQCIYRSILDKKTGWLEKTLMPSKQSSYNQMDRWYVVPEYTGEPSLNPSCKQDLFVDLVNQGVNFQTFVDDNWMIRSPQEIGNQNAPEDFVCLAALLNRAVENAGGHRLSRPIFCSHYSDTITLSSTYPKISPKKWDSFVQKVGEELSQSLITYGLHHLHPTLRFDFSPLNAFSIRLETKPHKSPEEELTHSRSIGFKIREEKVNALNTWIQQAETALPEETRQEMEGLAKGARVAFRDVVIVNVFADCFPGTAACSALASTFQKGQDLVATLSTTNHFISQGEPLTPCQRLQQLESIDEAALIASPLHTHKEAMARVGDSSTMQSILFDPSTASLHVSTSHGNAAKKTYTTFSKLFPNRTEGPSTERNTTLSRTFDWKWPLGPDTLIQVREGVASVSWPGFIGTVSGMNQHGLSLAVCAAGSESNLTGTPNQLLLREMLKNASTVDEAVAFLKQSTPASSMNVTLAGTDGIARIELDPAREKVGPATVIRA